MSAKITRRAGKTYGSVTYDAEKRCYRIKATPHVAIKLKRHFTRAVQNRQGEIVLTDNPEVGRDLEWLLTRYPLILSAGARARIAEQAEKHRETEQAVEEILLGRRTPTIGFRDPVREPRDYQYAPAELVWQNGHLLLTDELGLGKSFSALMILRRPEALPALVVVPTHLQQQWAGELTATLPWLNWHIIARSAPYDLAAKNNGFTPDVLFTTYFKLNGWRDVLAGEMNTVIFDEAQELRRHGSDKYFAAAHIAHAAPYSIGLTATPVYNFGGEIFNVVDVLAPDALGDRLEFSREWCQAGAWDNGKARVADPTALSAYLRDSGIMLRRSREEVGRELPAVERIAHTIDIDEKQLQKLTDDAVDLAAAILTSDKPTERWQASGEFDMKLRQATGLAKAPYVAEFVRMMIEQDEPVVLFGWHRAVYDVWAEKLDEYTPAWYTGSETPNQKNEHARRFLARETPLMFMSVRAGAGLDGLQAVCSTPVFGELDWSPGMHDQAIGRFARDGQVKPVFAYFLIANSGADPVISDVLQLKRMQSTPINDPDAKLVGQHVDTDDRVKLLARAFLEARGLNPDEIRPPEPAQLHLVPDLE